MAGRNTKAAATGLQAFIDAMVQSMEKADDRKAQDAREERSNRQFQERLRLEREQFEALQAHRRKLEEQGDERIANKGTGSRTFAAEVPIKDFIEGQWNTRNDAESNDPYAVWEQMNKRPETKVGSLPSILQITAFKDRKPEDKVTVGDEEVAQANKALATRDFSVLGDLDPGMAAQELKQFLTKKPTFAERHKISGPDELQGIMQRFRPEWEKRSLRPASQPAPDSQQAPQSQPTVQSRDGNVIDHISQLYAQRLSRDPQAAVMAGHELRKLGYPSIPSPFDMTDPQGNPSPELLQAAQTDPQLGTLLQAQQQTQQQLQGAPQPQQAGRQPMGRTAPMSRPDSRPALGPQGPIGGKPQGLFR